ncbi:hypothetical protein ACVW19_005669 [Streptomyces sp. TE5632]
MWGFVASRLRAEAPWRGSQRASSSRTALTKGAASPGPGRGLCTRRTPPIGRYVPMINKLIAWRGIATRYDKTSGSCLACLRPPWIRPKRPGQIFGPSVKKLERCHVVDTGGVTAFPVNPQVRLLAIDRLCARSVGHGETGREMTVKPKTAGQTAFAAGSKIATHSTCEVMENTCQTAVGEKYQVRRYFLSSGPAVRIVERQTSVTSEESRPARRVSRVGSPCTRHDRRKSLRAQVIFDLAAHKRGASRKIRDAIRQRAPHLAGMASATTNMRRDLSFALGPVDA